MRAGPELVKVRGNVIEYPIADWDGPPGCLRLEGREDVVLRLLENLNAPHFALHAGDSQTRSLTEAQARTGAEGPCYPVARRHRCLEGQDLDRFQRRVHSRCDLWQAYARARIYGDNAVFDRSCQHGSQDRDDGLDGRRGELARLGRDEGLHIGFPQCSDAVVAEQGIDVGPQVGRIGADGVRAQMNQRRQVLVLGIVADPYCTTARVHIGTPEYVSVHSGGEPLGVDLPVISLAVGGAVGTDPDGEPPLAMTVPGGLASVCREP